MDKALYFIYAGGVLHIGWAVFHLLFPRIFKWGSALEPLDTVNRSIYQVINLCLTFYFAAAAYLSLALLAYGLPLIWAGR